MALGKNLGTILSDYFGEETVTIDSTNTGLRIVEIPIKQISISQHQTRKHFDVDKIKALAKNIQISGLINPITVYKTGDEEYTLLTGERRLRAYKSLKKGTIPCIVKDDKNLTEDDKFIISASENLQREDLNPLELAKTFLIIMKKNNWTAQDMAESIGTTRQYVANYLQLIARLSPVVVEAVEQNKLSESKARQLVKLQFTKQEEVLEEIISKDLTVRQIIHLVNQSLETTKKAEWTHSISSKKIGEVQNLMKQFNQSKVKIQGNDQKGKIIITWG
jgi:ParB family transcriptional regulator, chromosome partitioning protein